MRAAIDNFNPRTPCGVRRPQIEHILLTIRFQSTHPLRGATRAAQQGSGKKQISIHAPLAGCDLFPFTLLFVPGNFNPRTPCGVRRGKTQMGLEAVAFQSTHPLRGATFAFCSFLYCLGISIHAPLAGCDIIAPYVSAYGDDISIHAPLAGCDDPLQRYVLFVSYFNPRTPCGVRLNVKQTHKCFDRFQSTHPLRGATLRTATSISRIGISIHAPLAGCDYTMRRKNSSCA